MAAQVGGELFHRAIAPVRVFGQGGRHDAVEIAPQTPPQEPGLAAAGVGQHHRRHCLRRPVAPHLERQHRPRARRRRLLLAHRARVVQVIAIEQVGRVAAQQAVEHDPQRIDVGGHCHRPPACSGLA